MGLIRAEIGLSNPRDEAIRPLAVTALVDTGALHLCIPEHVAIQLGLAELYKREVKTADGQTHLVPYVGPVAVTFDNRHCFTGAMVIGDDVLLGAVPMEDMDVLISPATQSLIVNPDSPNIPRSIVKWMQPRPGQPAFFVSADWSKDARKRSVHVADLSRRCIWREERDDWNLTRLLDLSIRLADRGSVLLGVDAALGVPPGYWGAVQAHDWRARAKPANFIEWLSRLDPDSDFFEDVREPREWDVARPFFRVPGRKGGLSDFTNPFDDGLRRRIDDATGAKPLFALSGIPGTVGSGTRALWKELIPRLAGERHFAVWPFDGDLGRLLSRSGIVLAETYPGLAYAAAVEETLPARQLKVAKTRPEHRERVCELLQATWWVRHFGLDLGDLDPARADEDAFDSHVTAAAVLRCVLDGRMLCDREWIDSIAGGAMLLAGPVDPSRPATTLRAGQDLASGRSAARPQQRALLQEPAEGATARPAPQVRTTSRPQPHVPAGHAEYPCPIRDCTHVFRDSRGGWDAHVASRQRHPDWHPDITDPEDRKQMFKTEYECWFRQ